jgi:hypothetical protein
MSTNDERIIKKTDFSQSESRKDRSTEDKERFADNALESKLRAIRTGWSDNILPDIIGEPGYHYCWLSTTNQSDPIYRRLRIGYELVKFDELKYLGEQNRVQSGEFAGCVSINELILAKIPNELYQEIMCINHYERPLQEEELLRANLESDEQDSDGRRLGQSYGDGIENLGRRVNNRRPMFE